MKMVDQAARQNELAKYINVYGTLETYHCQGKRQVDAQEDIRIAYDAGCRSFLDISCGRGELLDFAEKLGYREVAGTEAVPELCDDTSRVMCLAAHQLNQVETAWELVGSFDVLEHLLPGDDEALIQQAGRIATQRILLTANNFPSRDPSTGADLHINIRPYQEWHELIADCLGSTWNVGHLPQRRSVSATFLCLPAA